MNYLSYPKKIFFFVSNEIDSSRQLMRNYRKYVVGNVCFWILEPFSVTWIEMIFRRFPLYLISFVIDKWYGMNWIFLMMNLNPKALTKPSKQVLFFKHLPRKLKKSLKRSKFNISFLELFQFLNKAHFENVLYRRSVKKKLK